MGVCGPSACGKSETVFKMMNDLVNKFDEFYLICPTYKEQELYQKRMIFKKDNVFESATDESFNKVMEKVEKNKNNKKKSLIICDDFIGSELTKNNSALCEYIPKIRHFSCSIILIYQMYKSVPPIIRNNLNYLIIFNLANKGAENVMFSEQSDKFKEKYIEKTKEKYKYLFVDFTKNEMDDARYI